MLSRTLPRQIRFYQQRMTSFRTSQTYSKDQQTYFGGLEKSQGGLKEEQYFNIRNLELINKMRQEGVKLKCEQSTFDNWNEFKKSIKSTAPTSLPVNKHKNCSEEAFFLNEHKQCCHLLNNEEKDAKCKKCEACEVCEVPESSEDSETECKSE